MLRSYTTIIRDSFRAALKSKVLTITLGLILLILLALAPFHLRESQDSTLSYSEHVVNPERLAKRLINEGKSGKRSAVAHIWNMLSEEVQSDLEKAAAEKGEPEKRKGPPQRNQAVRKFIDELDGLLSDGSIYDEKAFEGKRLSDEAKALVEKGDGRSAKEDRRLNRLLVSTALRRDIRPPKASQLDFYYFVWHAEFLTTSISHSAFASGVTNQLPVFFDKFVMSIGIFIALLVTASIIPEMLEPGSLNLLLSKPIFRWGLLLTKYIGGCAFILLCAGLFFTGIYFWMGIQLNIWESSILYSIPVYVLVFAMYYSVSVLAGIWFRSPILSITFAILFWAVCSLIGWGHVALDNQQYNSAPRQLVATNDDVLQVNIFQKTKQWDSGDWKNIAVRSGNSSDQEAMEEAMMEGFVTYFGRLDEFPDLPGPVFDGQSNMAMIAESMVQPEGRIPNNLRVGMANGNDAWSVNQRFRLPNGTRQVFHSKRFGWMAINQSGRVFQLDTTEPKNGKAKDKKAGDENGKADDAKKTGGDMKGNGKKKSGLMNRMLGSVSMPNITSGHKDLSKGGLVNVPAPSHVSLNPSNDEIAVYDGTELSVLTVNAEGQYELKVASPIGTHTNYRMTAFVQHRGDKIFLALGNSHFYLINASDLSVIDEQTISEREAVRTFAASNNGRYAAAVLRSGQLWIYDADNKRVYTDGGIPRQDVLAATFDDQNRLWVGTRFRAAQQFELSSGEELSSLEPTPGWMTNAFRYVIRPLYRVFPKPGEFYKVVSHLSSSGDAKNNPDIDLTKLPQRDDPWSPLKSGLVFTGLMLLISCAIFQRMDF